MPVVLAQSGTKFSLVRVALWGWWAHLLSTTAEQCYEPATKASVQGGRLEDAQAGQVQTDTGSYMRDGHLWQSVNDG